MEGKTQGNSCVCVRESVCLCMGERDCIWCQLGRGDVWSSFCVERDAKSWTAGRYVINGFAHVRLRSNPAVYRNWNMARIHPKREKKTWSLPTSTLLLEDRTGTLEASIRILVWCYTAHGAIIQSLTSLEVHAVTLNTVRTSIWILLVILSRPLCRRGDAIGGRIPLTRILRHGTRRLVRFGRRVTICGCTTSIAHDIVQIAGRWSLALRRWVPRVPLSLVCGGCTWCCTARTVLLWGASHFW